MAARPSGSGQRENGPANMDVIGLSVKWWRGSVDSVIGMASGWVAASALQLVVPLRERAGVGGGAEHAEVGEPPLGDERRRRREREEGLELLGVAREHHGVEEQRGLVLHGHPAEEIVDPPLDVDLGVLVREGAIGRGHQVPPVWLSFDAASWSSQASSESIVSVKASVPGRLR